MTDSKIGQTLKELRNHSGKTQDDISKDLNITRQTYSYYETGTRIPSLEMACRLAAYYHITLDQLVLPDGYRQLVQKYHRLPMEKQRTLLAFLNFLSRNTK